MSKDIKEEDNINFDVINKVIKLSQSFNSIELLIPQVCDIVPAAYLYPEYVSVKITINDQHFFSSNYKESQWLNRRLLDTPGMNSSSIEVYYSNDFIKKSGKEFLLKDNEFLDSVAVILSGSISRFQLEKLLYDNTERVKELHGIKRTADILNKGVTLEESLQEICSCLPEAWQYPDHTAVRITFEDKVFTSRNFNETSWVQSQYFETLEGEKGLIEVYYLKEFPLAFEGPFLKEERDLIDNLAALISGTVSKNALKKLLIQNTERLKELKGINQTSFILKQSKSIEESLKMICSILPEAWQYPEYTAVKIIFEKQIFTSSNFKKTRWKQKQFFETPGHKKGTIEVYYLKEFPQEDEGPFLKEERNLLVNLSNLIAGSASRQILSELLRENKERLKELKAINQTSKIIAEGKSIHETLQGICFILPRSWQYPKYTGVRITYEGETYNSHDFPDTIWVQKESFVTIDNKKGTIKIFYLKKFPKAYEGPFLKEERNLLINIAKLISGYLNNYKGREVMQKNIGNDRRKNLTADYRESLISNKQPLQLFFNKQVLDKYIYLDMMKYKVKEILFVATLYDAYSLQAEDNFFERFMGVIYQYSLFSLPRITGVTSPDEAMALLNTTHFDLVILMVGLDRDIPVDLSKRIKQKQPNLLVYLLLNQRSNIKYFEELVPRLPSIDKVFTWNGNSQIFFAIVKSVEDKANVENDTKIGLVRIILLVEDSAQYYSKYLQILYSIVFDQVQQLLPEVEKNELDKIAKMRSRPKILLARNYEDALYIFNKYKDFLLCVISDIEFEKDGKLDKKAGVKFIQYVKSHILNLPIILQSSDNRYKKLADELKTSFINKNSESLLNDLKKFLTQYLGFGDFVFRDKDGNQIAKAHSLREFETLLPKVPDETFYLHARENQFSLWLMARGEIQLARTLNSMKIKEGEDFKKSKLQFLETLKAYKEEKKKGKVLNFEETSVLDEKNIIAYSSGSFGGKGRGLAFISALINNFDFSSFNDQINIRAPKTVIIGTDEFENFLESNKLYDIIINNNIDYQKLRKLFVKGELTHSLVEKLKIFLNQVNRPIAVRSSSLLEDSISQPFAGIFDTYILPYNGCKKKDTLEKLVKAIKLVYASIYSDEARAFYTTIHHKIEEEKMAVVLQELVGTQFDNYYYPHISGVAQSYNFYPIANMDPDDGFAVIALGLGPYVVGGLKSYRFSPKYPKVEMYSTRDILNSSQVQFYALDFTQKDIDYVKDGELASLKLLDIDVAEKHGALKHLVSVYDSVNDRIDAGLSSEGPRILNFADILKFNCIPLAETIDMMMNTIQDAFRSPVEIEFAVDLSPTLNELPSFYLLQVKPLVGTQYNYNIDFSQLDKSRMILYSETALGNGEINDIYDVVYIDAPHFDKLKTLEMAAEVEFLNNKLRKLNRQYILIGPGRWGTRDRFLGVPVNWNQISNAKVIVEISLANYPLDSSLGSHFFHNITSMNIGYFSVHDSSSNNFIRWNQLNQKKIDNRTKYFKHIQFNKPLSVLMNGKMRCAAIIDNS